MSNTVNTAEDATAILAEAKAEGAKGKTVKERFGEGRYSAVMAEAYADALRLTDMSQEHAERFAKDLGSDLGRHFAAQPVTVKYGAVKGERITLAEAAKCKAVPTKALSLARLIAKANELRKEAQGTGELCVAEVKFTVNY